MDYIESKDLSLLDMTMLYTDLYWYGFVLEIDIPQVIIVKNITGIKAWYDDARKNIRAILIGEKELSRENLPADIIQFLESCEKQGYTPRINMTLFYFYGVEIAKSLTIKCPQIIIGDSNASVIAPDDSGLNCITIKPEKDFNEIVMILAYEMRHAWQHEKHPHIYLNDYNSELFFTDEKTYMLQKAEIDASAYGYRFVNDILKLNWGPNSIYPEVNHAITKREKKMSVHYTDTLLCFSHLGII